MVGVVMMLVYSFTYNAVCVAKFTIIIAIAMSIKFSVHIFCNLINYFRFTGNSACMHTSFTLYDLNILGMHIDNSW